MTALGIFLLGAGVSLVVVGITDPPGGLPGVISRAVTGGGLKLRPQGAETAAYTDPGASIQAALAGGAPPPAPAARGNRRPSTGGTVAA